MTLLLRWLVSAVALLIVAYFIPGVHVTGFGAALIAALMIGIVNATIGLVVNFLMLPFRILTLGLLSLVINAILLMIAAALVPGFFVDGFWAAFFGSILLSIVTAVLGMLIPGKETPAAT